MTTTAARTMVSRPRRWDVPFGDRMTEADVARLRTSPPFSGIDASRFPPALPLDGILLNDARLVRFLPGEVIVREGDYGHSAFVVLSGSARLVTEPLARAALGRSEPKRQGLLAAMLQPWTNSRVRESRRVNVARTATPHRPVSDVPVFLQDANAVIDSGGARFGPGEMFGEIAALGRTPRTATVVAGEASELCEIRWQGLRELRLRSDDLRAQIDRLYRERSLAAHLTATWPFERLAEGDLAQVIQATEFESYGTFDWYGSYAALAAQAPEERLLSEPVIVAEGDYPNGLILIRAGFVRVSRQAGAGHRTVSYAGRGQAFGFREIARSWRDGEGRAPAAFGHTLRAVGYVDVLRIPTRLIEQYVMPSLTDAELTLLAAPDTGMRAPDRDERLPDDLLEFFVDHRIINGTSAMIIDLDRCTRCDDCVQACATAHDGNPRFVRAGPIHGRHMAAGACMHCQDPVCMIGCPTGAIHREESTGTVLVNDTTCIGCGTCAASCPYGQITMVGIRDTRGHEVIDTATHAPILKATKCDLCVDQWSGPACQLACPHDALRRADMRDPAAFSQWLRR